MMSRPLHKTLLVLFLAASALWVAPAQAGGGHHHGYGYGHYRPHYRPHHGYHHGYRRHYGVHGHHHDGYKYIGAGLLLGAVAHGIFSQPRVERTVVRTVPAGRVYTPAPRPAPAAPPPAPIERPDVYLRKDPNGECWLIERVEDGSEIITPQSPEVCD